MRNLQDLTDEELAMLYVEGISKLQKHEYVAAG